MLRKFYKPTNLLIPESEGGDWTRESLSNLIGAFLSSSALIKSCLRWSYCHPDRKQEKSRWEQRRWQRRQRGNVAACREWNGLEGGSDDKVGTGQWKARNQTLKLAENGEKKTGSFFQVQMAPGFSISLLSVVSNLNLSRAITPSPTSTD